MPDELKATDHDAQPLVMGNVVRLPAEWNGELEAETGDKRASIVETVSGCGKYVACMCKKKGGNGRLTRRNFLATELKIMPKYFATRHYREIKDKDARVKSNGWMVGKVEQK